MSINSAPNPYHIETPTGFMKAAVSFLDRVSYKICKTPDELERLFELRRSAYVSANYLEPTHEKGFSDELDFVANVIHVGVFVDGNLVAGLRLHTLDTANRRSCAMDLFNNFLTPY